MAKKELLADTATGSIVQVDTDLQEMDKLILNAFLANLQNTVVMFGPF